MNVPALPPGTPTTPHPIDVALAALSDHVAVLLTSTKPSRFFEIQNVTSIALRLQRLRPHAGVDDVHQAMDEDEWEGEVGPVMRRHHIRPGRWNDAADINTQVLMMAQEFLKQYAEIEKSKANRKPLDIRLSEVSELAELFALRMKMRAEGEPVPPEIEDRANVLIKRIGEPSHEPSSEPGSDPVVPAEHVRGREADGAGQPDGGGVGEPIAERAAGDGGAHQEVRPVELPG